MTLSRVVYSSLMCLWSCEEEHDRDGMICMLLMWVGDKKYSEENVQRNSQKDIISQA